MPRPPETTTEASDSCGREPFSSTTVSTIFAPLAASDSVDRRPATSSAAPDDGSGANEFGRTVMTGVPLVTFDCTVIAAPKICWVALPSASKPTAS